MSDLIIKEKQIFLLERALCITEKADVSVKQDALVPRTILQLEFESPISAGRTDAAPTHSWREWLPLALVLNPGCTTELPGEI